MHILLMIVVIAAGILLAVLLLPVLGLFAQIILGAVLILGLIFFVIYNGMRIGAVASDLKEGREERKKRKKWIESLPEEQRAVEMKKEEEVNSTVNILKIITFSMLGVLFLLVIYLITIL